MGNDLSKRAIACKGWRWMPGMSVDGMVVVDADESGLEVVRKGTVQDWPPEYAYPDLTDAATLGCLLALVRGALGCDCAIRRWSHGWALVDAGSLSFYSHVSDTEAEALVAALEAAEGREVSDD